MAPALVAAGDIMEFDLDGNATGGDARTPYVERFIHGAIYKARPDVTAVVHSHSPSVIPFGVTGGSAAADLSHERLPRRRRADLRDPRRRRDDRHADPRQRARRRARADAGAAGGGADARPRLGRGRQLDPAGRVPSDLHRDERAPADGGDAARHDQLPRAGGGAARGGDERLGAPPPVGAVEAEGHPRPGARARARQLGARASDPPARVARGGARRSAPAARSPSPIRRSRSG